MALHLNHRLSANRLLASLPEEDLSRLEPFFSLVPLVAGERLLGVDDEVPAVFFPLEGAIVRLAQIPSGESVELGLVGPEGAVGLPLALGGHAAFGLSRVQISGRAAVIGATAFDEHVRSRRGMLFDRLLRYAGMQLRLISQLTACHSLHRIEQRLTRCILALADRSADRATVRVTHDALADFLGVHRPSVTYAVQALSALGLLSAERRRLIVLDRPALEQHACECYAMIRKLTEGG